MKGIKLDRCISTYSIVGADPVNGEVGVAVQSKFLAVGNVVQWGKGGVGAVATQAWANASYGNRGIEMMEQGIHPEEIVKELIAGDERKESRQFGIVDVKGRSANFTGADCANWAGGKAGPCFAAQGNILTGPEVVDAMADTFQKVDGDLTTKLMEALGAAQDAGGDKRGMQSAALAVWKIDGGYGGMTDRLVDLRVDEHKNPIEELRRLLELSRFYFGRTKEDNYAKIEGDVKKYILETMENRGHYNGEMAGDWNKEKDEAFQYFSLVENFDERLAPFGLVDNEVLAFMKKNF
jgi:uncharacterized Ntn-hydrolase superfamily protein